MPNYFIPDPDHQEVSIKTVLDEKSSREFEIISTVTALRGTRINHLWGAVVGGSVDSTPLFHEGKVIFGSCDKNLYAVYIDTGKLAWKFGVQAPIFYLGCLDKGRVYFGSFDERLYCVNADSGKKIWDLGIGSAIATGPNIHNNILYFGARDGNFYAVSTDGVILWRFATNGPIVSYPTIYKEKIYFGSWDHNLYCIDTESGQLVWKFRTGEKINCSPTAYDGMIIFGSYDHRIYSLSAENGSLIWSRGFEAPEATQFNPVSKGIFFFGLRNRNFVALDIKTGGVKWRFSGGDIMSGSSVVHNGVVYFGSCNHNIYAVSEDKGKLLWKFSTSGLIDSALRMYDGTIYAGSWDCNLYAINTDGELVWKFPTSLGYPAIIEEDEQKDVTAIFEVTIKHDIKRKEKYKESETLGDYGTPSGQYTNISQYKLDLGHYTRKDRTKYT